VNPHEEELFLFLFVRHVGFIGIIIEKDEVISGE
jgi:hypothetical protein